MVEFMTQAITYFSVSVIAYSIGSLYQSLLKDNKSLLGELK